MTGSQQARDPKRADNCSSMNVGRLETQEESMFQFESEDRKRLRTRVKAVRQEEFPLIGLLVLFRFSTDWMRPTHHGEANLLSSVP